MFLQASSKKRGHRSIKFSYKIVKTSLGKLSTEVIMACPDPKIQVRSHEGIDIGRNASEKYPADSNIIELRANIRHIQVLWERTLVCCDDDSSHMFMVGMALGGGGGGGGGGFGGEISRMPDVEIVDNLLVVMATAAAAPCGTFAFIEQARFISTL